MVMKLTPQALTVYGVQQYGEGQAIEGVGTIDLRRFRDDGGSMVELLRLAEARPAWGILWLHDRRFGRSGQRGRRSGAWSARFWGFLDGLRSRVPLHRLRRLIRARESGEPDIRPLPAHVAR